jgi:glucosamine--fructose-6-phosphate aminotransferase (isomerizing)
MDDILFSEILEQPAVIRQLLTKELANIQKISRDLKGKFKYIVIAARGTSDNAARYAQYVLGAFNQIQVALATPSLFTIYNSPPDLSDALVIGISQSGQSPDIVAVLEEARKQDRPTLCITNEAQSPLAEAAEFLLPLNAGNEKAVAATKTYTASLTAMALISTCLSDDDKRMEEIRIMSDKLDKVLESALLNVRKAERYRYIDHCVVLGRGFNYSTAFEVALKVKELTRVVTVPYSSADFKHGPIATIQKGFPVIVISSSGEMGDHIDEFTRKVLDMGAELIVISDQETLLEKSRLGFRIAPGIPEWLSPIANVLPGQLFARQLALEKGLDIDRPEGITKVTETF